MNGFRYPVFVAALVLIAGCMGGSHVSALKNLGPAPDYSAKKLDGSAFSVKGELGKPLLINLWATWCTNCPHEMAQLQKLRSNVSQAKLSIVGVSMDGEASDNEIKAFVSHAKISYTIVHDPDGQAFIPAFYKLGAMGTPPETFLIDAKGTVVYAWQGAFDPMSATDRGIINETL